MEVLIIDTIKQAVEKFLSKRGYTRGFKKSTVENLMKGKASKDDSKVIYAFLQQKRIMLLQDKTIDDAEICIEIESAIIQSVKSYNHAKDVPIAIYKRFLEFLENSYKISIPMEWPQIFASSFDRQMYIVKAMHEKELTVSQLEDELWISDRTIEDDLSNLKNMDGVAFLGQRVKIKEVGRTNGVTQFKSTVHPIFLASNLTQVVVMLEGLQHMMKDEAYRGYAQRLAQNIWSELSDYGKRRIKEVSGMLNLDTSWYDEIDNHKSSDLFHTEDECSEENGLRNILNFFKNGEQCAVEYCSEDGESKILHDCYIKNYDHQRKEVTIAVKDVTFLLKSNAILKISKLVKYLY